MKHENVWPEKLMIRDTGIIQEEDGTGRIYTTVGRGYEKRAYVRADCVPTGEPIDSERELNNLAIHFHNESARRGWWDELLEVQNHVPGHLKAKVELWFLATKIALIHSEASELLEALRTGDFENEHSEAADIFIRLADYCGRRNIPLGSATEVKAAINKDRPDHDPDARAQPGGKGF